MKSYIALLSSAVDVSAKVINFLLITTGGDAGSYVTSKSKRKAPVRSSVGAWCDLKKAKVKRPMSLISATCQQGHA